MPEGIQDEILAIYATSFKEIYRYCAFRLFKTDVAEDATAAVFLQLVQKYPDIRTRSDSEIREWLFGVASNVCASHRRGIRRRNEISQSVAAACEPASMEQEDDNRLDWPVLYRAISKLKPQHQEIIVLRYFRGLEASAIAEHTGLTHVNVRVQLSRAIRRLRHELRKPFDIIEKTSR